MRRAASVAGESAEQRERGASPAGSRTLRAAPRAPFSARAPRRPPRVTEPRDASTPEPPLRAAGSRRSLLLPAEAASPLASDAASTRESCGQERGPGLGAPRSVESRRRSSSVSQRGLRVAGASWPPPLLAAFDSAVFFFARGLHVKTLSVSLRILVCPGLCAEPRFGFV
ncbi:unnamed protein product [Lampetra fluviatilis]